VKTDLYGADNAGSLYVQQKIIEMESFLYLTIEK
jgi:hypothetical protein